ncbi:MAG: hypothetical protein A3G76_13305 [Acidobacteria bacterium RIFCSPLOWO2_12_FULL_65_11]|nr:MAG: hypothetical protein A3G76_13305 [Acidobacteria bacterium RIFCSPLOWO2_12_FULL_65_11]
MRTLLVAAFVAAFAAEMLVAWGQVTFRSGVEVVRLDVSVTRGGRPVTGLTADDFDVRDAGVPQHMDGVLVEKLPLSVVLVLDMSWSVDGTVLRHLVEAAQTLAAAIRPADRAALITFSKGVTVRVPLTTDVSTIRSALASLAVEENHTALRDAVSTALRLVVGHETRPLVMAFTDGCDNSSRISESDVLDTARRIRVVMHAIMLGDCGRSGAASPGRPNGTGRAELDRLAFLQSVVGSTGGRLWLLESTSSRQLPQSFTRALDEMRARYVLTYYPQGVARDGWHELKVRLKRGRADIKARSGYFVPPRE